MKRKKLLLLCLLSSFPLMPMRTGNKPPALLLPIRFVGFFTSEVQKSLNNYVRNELAHHYMLKTKKEVERAGKIAADGNLSRSCTDTDCIKTMGEILDVEYIFKLKIVAMDKNWRLSATQINKDGRNNPHSELCTSCNPAEARKILVEMLLALRSGRRQVQLGKATLQLKSTPKAWVFLDGKAQGETPLTLSITPGKSLEVMLLAEGYRGFNRTFVLEPGEEWRENIIMEPKRGLLKLNSTPAGAMLFIDGRPEVDAGGKVRKTPTDLRLPAPLSTNKTPENSLQPKPSGNTKSKPVESTGSEPVKSFAPHSEPFTTRPADDDLEITVQTARVEPDNNKKSEKELKDNRVGVSYNAISAFLESSSKQVELDYKVFGLSYQYQMVKLEFIIGYGTVTYGDLNHFYFYDEGRLKKVDSTQIIISRALISPIYSTKWLVTDFGYETVTILLGADYGNPLEINLIQPTLNFGYQKLWSSGYIQVKYGYSFVNKKVEALDDPPDADKHHPDKDDIFDYRTGPSVGIGLFF